MSRLIHNLISFLALLLVLSLVLFLAFRFLPGDPAKALLGLDADPDKLFQLRHELGLDRPLHEQYLHSITGLFSREDPLLSLRFKTPVRQLIASRLPLTLSLASLSFLLIILLALPLALFAAYHAGQPADRFTAVLTRLTQAVPPFFMAMLLSLLMARLFSYFQPNFYPEHAPLYVKLKILALPSLAIALPRIAQAFQFLRDALVGEWQKEYVLRARSQGASRRRILLVEILPNALIPFVTSTGLILVEILTNTLLVEQVFKLPGVGQLLFASVAQRDFPLAQAMILLLSSLIITINRLVDLANRSLDPRLSLRRASSAPVTQAEAILREDEKHV